MTTETTNIVSIQPYNDGVEIRFPLMALPQNQFDALMQSIERNRTSGKITVLDLSHRGDNDILTIKIGGIEDCIPEFITLIKSELVVADIMPPETSSLKEKVLEDFHKLVDNPIEP